MILRYFILFFMSAVSLPVLSLPQDSFVVRDAKNKDSDYYRDGEILVKFINALGKNTVLTVHKNANAKIVTEYRWPEGLQLVRISANKSFEAALKIYKESPFVEYAEPNYYYDISEAPNDADFPKQWALKNTGLNSGLVGADINNLSAWDISVGSTESVIGIIDTGILYSHPDLAENMWINPGEIPGNNIDDDLNGYIDDIHGINAITKSGDPRDDHGHGTHVAGIIGAKGNNSIGISGVNQQTSMIGCKFLDARGSGSASDAITCINYFAELATRKDHPIRIVATNNSWGGGGFSQALFDAIKVHEDKGILFVAAAGNDSRNNNSADSYPSNYALSNIISVAATDNRDELAYFSNHGSKTVHVAAPGTKILSTYMADGYKELSGTSMAAPHVSGLVGLMRAVRPELDFIQTRNLIITSGTKISSVQNKTISGRRITAASKTGLGALTCIDQVVKRRLLPKETSYTIPVGGKVDLSVMSLNCEYPAQKPLVFSLGAPLSLNDDGFGGDHLANDGVFSAQFAPSTAGRFSFDFGGGDIVSVNVFDPKSWHDYVPHTGETFLYRTISGTNLGLGDDGVKSVEVPFPIRFGGDLSGFSQIQVGSNGILSFTSSGISAYQNVELPYGQVDTLIAPYWDDLSPGPNGGVFYEVQGKSPNREFIVEWRKMSLYGSGASGSLQVVFFEDSSDVLFNYLDVGFGDSGFGKTATIGIQTAKDAFTQYSFNQTNITNNLALRFSKN